MTSEQMSLLKKAGTGLQAAKLLAEQGFYEIAVSRSYYVMFYVAQAFLLGDGLSFSKHSAVIAPLVNISLALAECRLNYTAI